MDSKCILLFFQIANSLYLHLSFVHWDFYLKETVQLDTRVLEVSPISVPTLPCTGKQSVQAAVWLQLQV